MAGLQRSSETFRRSGSSGLVWEDLHLPAEINNSGSGKPKEQSEPDTAALRQSLSVGSIGMMRRTRSDGRGVSAALTAAVETKPYRTDQVAPALDPPSPKVSCCGFCGDFSKAGPNSKAKTRRR